MAGRNQRRFSPSFKFHTLVGPLLAEQRTCDGTHRTCQRFSRFFLMSATAAMMSKHRVCTARQDAHLRLRIAPLHSVDGPRHTCAALLRTLMATASYFALHVASIIHRAIQPTRY
eukprot:1733901-Pleurochrysis_carterae.AAC.6